MIVIDPVTIGAAQLISSTALESTLELWSAEDSFAAGATVRKLSTNRAYRSLQNANLNHDPEDEEDVDSPVWWEDLGPVNRWAMFDLEVNTQTVGEDELTVVIEPGAIDGLFLDEMVGAELYIEVLDVEGGEVVFEHEQSLDGSLVTDWWEYFDAPFVQVGRLLFLDIPSYTTCRIKVTITGEGEVRLGALVVGKSNPIGATLAGVESGFLDYSTKKTNAKGVTRLKPGHFRRTMRLQVQVEPGAGNAIHQRLIGFRGRPCVYVGDDDGEIDPFTFLGFYKDFVLSVPYVTVHYYSFQLESLT